jgi:hypothetical protein
MKYSFKSSFLTITLMFSSAVLNNPCFAQNTPKQIRQSRSKTAETEMTASANLLIKSMNSKVKKEALFTFDSPKRLDWRYLPPGRSWFNVFLPKRVGTQIINLDVHQTELLRKLLESGLSYSGVDAIDAALELENVKDIKFRGWLNYILFKYGPENYYLSFYGTPGDKNWGWKFEGHHISLNFTIDENRKITLAPAFLGTTINSVSVHGRQVRVLDSVKLAALELNKSLSTDQLNMSNQSLKKVPRFTDFTPGLFKKRVNIKKPLPAGLSFRALSESQKGKLLVILKRFQDQFSADLSQEVLAEIERDGLNNLEYIYAGDPTMKEVFYFRVQGNNFALEFSCSEGKSDHYHAAWVNF